MVKSYSQNEVRVATVLRYFIGDFPKLVVWEELLERHGTKFTGEQVVSQICSEINTFKPQEIREILYKMESEGVIICVNRTLGQFVLNEQDKKVAAFITFFTAIINDEIQRFKKRKRIISG